jgi:hypothetical protein
MRVLGAAVIAAFSLGIGAASAQTAAPVPMQAEMQTELNDAADLAGYVTAGDHQKSFMLLREGEGAGLKLEAKPNVTYFLASTCKSGCAELQLDLRSMDQDVLQTQTSRGGGLITTQISVAKPGPMIVLAAMMGCKSESGCPAGVTIYEQKKQ